MRKQEQNNQRFHSTFTNPGIAGAIIFLILLVLLIWMICVRATRPKKQEKVGLGPGAEMAHGGAPNFYYGAPAPYAESIAPSHHSTYAHYYDDEEDGWDMPNFYNEGYMKVGPVDQVFPRGGDYFFSPGRAGREDEQFGQV